MELSKGNIDRLGNLIRSEKYSLSDDTLTELQEYRTSHQDTLSAVFTVLCSYIRKIHSTSIVTYRIKRFESIIGKLVRFPEMRFSRMWDIGGCRFIVRNNDEVYKVKSLIEKDSRIAIIKEYDYIVEPQVDGYKALHLFVKCNKNDKAIEVQIRSLQDHNWATLVEITDVLYDSKIKELSDNPDLGRFHFLLSKVSELNIIEKKEIAEIIERYAYFERLSEVFSRNYIKVRQQWFNIQNRKNHRYFLIETSKAETPKIYSYKNSSDAEKAYLEFYKKTQNANIVLTHLPHPSYRQISIAYSNYILTFHSFLDECYDILESLMVEALEEGKLYDYYNILSLYNALLFEHVRNLMTEFKEVNYYSQSKGTQNKGRNKEKHDEWIKDIKKEIYRSNQRILQVSDKIINSTPKTALSRFAVKSITLYIGNKYKRKLKRVQAA